MIREDNNPRLNIDLRSNNPENYKYHVTVYDADGKEIHVEKDFRYRTQNITDKVKESLSKANVDVDKGIQVTLQLPDPKQDLWQKNDFINTPIGIEHTIFSEKEYGLHGGQIEYHYAHITFEVDDKKRVDDLCKFLNERYISATQKAV